MPLNLQTHEELLERMQAELHVLVIVLSQSWGGLEQTALSDAIILSEAGTKVTLLVRADSPVHVAAKAQAPKMRIEIVGERVRNYFDQQLIRKLRWLVDQEGVNLIHCHQTTLLGSIVPALFRRQNVGLVASRHILNSHNKRDPIHALIYRRVDYLAVLSRTMRSNLIQTLPIEEKKLRIVNLGIDFSLFAPEKVDAQKKRKEWGIPADALLLGVVGRLDPMKGQDLVIKALARLRLKYPQVYAVMVGNETPGLDGEYIRELQESIAQLRLTDFVKVLPAVKDVPEIMAALDCFVMPSWSEAFGLVALEAMAMGKPCLLSRSGSAQELAVASGSELFRPRDAYDLARKLELLIADPALRLQMGITGRRFVEENHSLDRRLEMTLEIYLRCWRRRVSQ